MSNPEPEILTPLKRAIIEIRELKARLAVARRRESEPIAIVGMGLRFPGGADDPETFWKLLWDGVDAITEVPSDRWPVDDLFDPDPDAVGKITTRFGGFLNDVDRFDAPFFAISPREASSMDPQQRLLLEVSWEALEHAGIPADDLFGSNAGVFLGIGNSDHFRMVLADPESIDSYSTTGNAMSIAAGRLSYVLGAQGPAVSVDTACSSSLVAVHLATQALRNRECEVALAGGVNLILSPELTINFSRARMMAPDGRCKTFDAAADGYVRAEGCAMVVLKRLSDAQAAGDHVLAVIRGSAVNQDGRSGGLTAPNGPSQERVIATAIAAADIVPNDVSYLEAHGTGTLLGDPIEVGALGAALCADRAGDQPLLLGSVKTNIGHTEAAAGIAGLIKVVLMLERGLIPPHLHLRELSPHIAATGLPIAIPTERTEWPESAGGRVAGVSSFGLSGTNAHVVLGEAPPDPSPVRASIDSTRGRHVLTLSAKDPKALIDLAGNYATMLSGSDAPSFAEVAFATNTTRSHLRHRLAIVATDSAAAVRRLHDFAGGATADAVTGSADTPSGVVFLFTGHGSHHPGMGRELYTTEPVFAAAIDRCDSLLSGQLDRTLSEILFADDGRLLENMEYAQPALFSLQYGLAELWRSWGIVPAVVAGHSAGEYVAAVVAGVMSLEDGLRIITARGRMMQSLPDDGAMVALFVDEATVAAAVAPFAADVGIAAVNGPTTTVISGRRSAVEAVISALDLGHDELRRLDISVAAHSPLVDPILSDFTEVVRAAALSRPTIGLVSSMTGRFADDELTSPDYWRRHLRSPVRFAEVFDTLRRDGYSSFVEIGPDSTLIKLGQRCWPDASATWAPSMTRDTDESERMLTSVAMLYADGASVDWRGFARAGSPAAEESARRRLLLPTYPWQRETFVSPAARWGSTASSRPAAQGGDAWPAAVTAGTHQSTQGPLDLGIDNYIERWATLDELAIAAIVHALRELDLFTHRDEVHEIGRLVDDGTITAGYEHLVTRWMEHLSDNGLLQALGNGRFTAPAPLPDIDLEIVLAAAASHFVGVEPLLDYVGRCADRLSAVVAGRDSALDTLFPGGSYETVDFLYSNWAVPRYFNSIVRAAVVAAAQAGPERTIRVLEVGAGTGGTTATVLPGLPTDRARYTFTDVSDFFLVRARERFATFPFVGYCQLDIEQAAEAQGHALASYDVVIASNVLHATRDLDVTLDNARRLLAPGGLLIAYEATHHPRWFDITTGLIEGWQRFDDQWRSGNPLIDAQQWSKALTAAGFVEVAWLPTDDQSTAVLRQHVLMARAPGDSRAADTTETRDHDAGMHETTGGPSASEIVLPESAALTDALDHAFPDERHDILVDFVRHAIASVLRITDAGRLRRDQPLLDLGFDSLMALELRNILRERLRLTDKLSATLVFDHPTINAIAHFLEQRLTGSSDAGEHVDEARSEPVAQTVDSLADLSEDEVEAMLLQRLTEIER